jgi:hypothetical protein
MADGNYLATPFQKCQITGELYTRTHPQQAPGNPPEGLDGWSFMMRTPEKDLAFLYFENQAVLPEITGFSPGKEYIFHWYNTLNGEWHDLAPSMPLQWWC